MTVVYRRFGGSTHVRIDTFAQLKEAVSIPETQWVATSAPVASLVSDKRFLELMDTDHNGRIRVDELQAAVHWMATMFEREGGIDSRAAMLTLTDLTPAADPLKAAALAVLDVVTAGDKSSISLTQVREAETPLRAAGRNGDGIVAPEHLPVGVRDLGAKIMALFPETKNRADKAGLSPETLATFEKERTALLEHLGKQKAVFVWGDDSLERARRIHAVADKLDEHFLLCRLIASQPDARERLRLAADRIEGLVGNRAAMEAALAALPIAPPDPSGVIAWSTLHRGPSIELLQAFAKEVAGPILGQTEHLTEAQWRDMQGKAAAILAWQATFDGSAVAGAHDMVESVTDDDLKALAAAQQKDLDEKDDLEAIADLERLVLFQRYILDLANSFLAMPDLYTSHRAMYERGWAVLAGRRYEFSLLVPDVAAHKTHTEQGTTCVIYGKVQEKDGTVAFEVVMPKTRGWSNELSVGKRGVFYDLDNKEFDIVVTHLVRQPVSVMEAALTPFLRIGEFLNKKLESMNAGVDDAVNKQTTVLGQKLDATKAAVTAPLVPGAPVAPPATPTPPATPSPAASPAPAAVPPMGNALAMGGLAVAAVGSSVAFIAAQLKALSVGDLISIVALGFLAIAAPSGFVGWLKLRKRNLAQLLEGAGWALNDRLRVTTNLAARVTQTPSRVKGSRLEVVNSPPAPGEPEDSDWAWKLGLVVAVIFVVLWQFREPLMRVGCHDGQIPNALCVAAGIPEPGAAVVAPTTAVGALPGSPAANAAAANAAAPAAVPATVPAIK